MHRPHNTAHHLIPLIPAKAGIQNYNMHGLALGPSFRWDERGIF